MTAAEASSEAGAGVPRLRRREAVLLAVVLLPAALGLRWSSATNWGAQFEPVPDAIEAVAGAQALVESGTYFLQIGPWKVQPRYSPGYSMLLTPALLLGLDGDQLWRTGAFFDWGVATLLGLSVLLAVRALRNGARRGDILLAFGAAATWLLAPLVATQGGFVATNQPATFFALLTLLGLGRELTRSEPRSGRLLLWGLTLGLVAAIRPIDGALLALAAIPWAWASLVRFGFRRWARNIAWFAAGAGALVLVTCTTLHRSGFPATRWSTYSIWTPESLGTMDRGFRWSYLLEAEVPYDIREGPRRETSNLDLVLRTLLGWPGLVRWSYIGSYWPAIGVAAFVGLAFRSRARSANARIWIATASIWAAAHIALVLLYVWGAARIMLPAFFVLTLAYWVLVGSLCGRSKPWRILASLLAALPLVLGVVSFERERGTTNSLPDRNAETRAGLARWTGPATGAGAFLPYDTVRAQALGLRPDWEKVQGTAKDWFRGTWHFWYLKGLGRIERGPDGAWVLDPVLESRSPDVEGKTESGS